MDLNKKREDEIKVVNQMISIYCKAHHHSGNQLCNECLELSEYAKMRSEKCPFMHNKTFCSNCKIHCYKPEMRAKIKKVMRYSGPRMLIVKPGLTIKHLYYDLKEKQQLKR